jgi:hypothetical protein
MTNSFENGERTEDQRNLQWLGCDIDTFIAMHKRQRTEWERRQRLFESLTEGVRPANVSASA